MFLPLTFLLTSYFGSFLFPVLGLIIGGSINFIVLTSMPLEVSLIGMSGVVYWMGATWLSLFVLIDTRKSIRHRLALALFITVVLFAPQSYKAEVSYLSHLLGYLFGILSGILYYLKNKKKFLAAEIKEVIESEDDFISEPNDAQLRGPEISRVL